ncbi:uncharacterized protein LOC134223898 [Armigeres subalbatus]|uniref:uncharacterized protein LOC134223898 n=1 Tax=Armigeres subalbatus TaxID=124917 RepID=UPI002ED36ADE
MSISFKKVLLLACLIGCVVSDITVDNKAVLALKKRSDVVAFSLNWCDVFYQEDFPRNVDCNGKPELVWDYFPSCCNGAYNCRNGAILDIYLCAPGYVYDTTAEICLEFSEDSCPYLNGGAGGGDDDTTIDDSTTEAQEIISCYTVVNGLIPHPSDCTKYVECINGDPNVRDCLEGYVYYAPFYVCLPGTKETCKIYTLEDLPL